MNQEVFAAVTDSLDRGESAALVTIVSAVGSTPQRVGAKMLVFADGRIVGTIGGGCYENDAFWKARDAITSRKPQLVHYELDDDFAQETGLICGGQMDVYIEPIEPSPELYIVGAGHVYVVIVTRGHTNDLEALRALAPRELRYLGLIGSRAKVARIYDELSAA